MVTDLSQALCNKHLHQVFIEVRTVLNPSSPDIHRGCHVITSLPALRDGMLNFGHRRRLDLHRVPQGAMSRTLRRDDPYMRLQLGEWTASL